MSVGFLLALTGPLAYADAHEEPCVSTEEDHCDIVDDTDGYVTLNGAYGITTVVIDGKTYALVASFNDDGVQIINISSPSFPTAVASIVDDNKDPSSPYDQLNGASSITTVVIDGRTYALVASFNDDGVQIINISNPDSPLPVTSVTDGVGGYEQLDGPRGITTVVIDGRTYALVASNRDNGVQIIDITNPYFPTAVTSIEDGDDYDQLGGAYGITTVVIDGRTYALVASFNDDGVQIIDISDPASPLPVSSVANGIDDYDQLNGAYGITTTTIGTSTYALVTSFNDDGVQIIDITNPYFPTAVTSIVDDEDGYDTLNSAYGITTTTIGTSTYALVASFNDNGVQIIDISDPYFPTAVTSYTDGVDGYDQLDGAIDITTVVIDGRTYALVASYDDDGVQIIDITISLSGNTSDEDRSNGDSSNKHKTRPTFGISHETNAQFVTGGFTFNENTFDITHNFWTPFAIQTIKIGEVNTISSTVFAPKELHVQEFLFGIPVVGEAHKAELGIEIFYTNQGVISNVNVVQETNIIDVDSLVVTYTESACTSEDTENLCDTTVLNMVFLEPLRHNVMALKAIDYKARTQITYLNEGFDISGESLNPMITMMIAGPEKYEGQIKVTQTAKYSNVWASEDGRTFEVNDYNTFKWINETHERTIDTGKINTRLHSEFYTVQNIETERANQIMTQICPRCADESYDKINDIFAYEYPLVVLKSEDTELQKLLDSENLRGQNIIDEMFALYYPSKVFN